MASQHLHVTWTMEGEHNRTNEASEDIEDQDLCFVQKATQGNFESVFSSKKCEKINGRWSNLKKSIQRIRKFEHNCGVQRKANAPEENAHGGQPECNWLILQQKIVEGQENVESEQLNILNP